jgi:hypothetical protein
VGKDSKGSVDGGATGGATAKHLSSLVQGLVRLGRVFEEGEGGNGSRFRSATGWGEVMSWNRICPCEEGV